MNEPMNRPISPNTVLELPDIPYLSDTIQITIENIKTLANEGFENLKNKLNKTSLTPGDALLEFYNYHESNEDVIIQLFCLSLCMLDSVKHSINEIQSNTYQKIMDYTVNMFNSKMDNI